MKVLLGEKVMVLPELTEEKSAGGIIIPEVALKKSHPTRFGVVAKKGTGTPWNRMENIHVKQRIGFKAGSGMPYEEETEDGHTAKYLILSYAEVIFE